jgi:hypothetical protein
MEIEKRKPVKAILFILLYFSYNRGKKNPSGINKITFRTVSTGPLIISKKGIKTILGENDLNA